MNPPLIMEVSGSARAVGVNTPPAEDGSAPLIRGDTPLHAEDGDYG